MEEQFNMINLSSLCEGCLSVDRNLSVVSNTERRDFYRNITQPTGNFRHPLALCWECTAKIKKISNTKKQFKDAGRHLFPFMLRRSGSLPTLSTLTTHVISQETTIHCHSKTNITTNYKPQITFENTNNSINLPENQVDEKDPLLVASEENKGGTETKVDTLSGREREPVFIKVDDDVCNEFEDNGNCDNVYLKAIVKPDPTKCESKHRGRKRKSKTVLEFDDSDDEPLKKKQEVEEVKPKDKRKKKEKCEDDVKPPRRRREQPPGVISGACTARSVRRLGLTDVRMVAVALALQEVEERQKALTSDAYLRHEHRCEHCVIGFNHASKLRNHNMKKHDKVVGWPCMPGNLSTGGIADCVNPPETKPPSNNNDCGKGKNGNSGEKKNKSGENDSSGEDCSSIGEKGNKSGEKSNKGGEKGNKSTEKGNKSFNKGNKGGGKGKKRCDKINKSGEKGNKSGQK